MKLTVNGIVDRISELKDDYNCFLILEAAIISVDNETKHLAENLYVVIPFEDIIWKVESGKETTIGIECSDYNFADMGQYYSLIPFKAEVKYVD